MACRRALALLLLIAGLAPAILGEQAGQRTTTRGLKLARSRGPAPPGEGRAEPATEGLEPREAAASAVASTTPAATTAQDERREVFAADSSSERVSSELSQEKLPIVTGAAFINPMPKGSSLPTGMNASSLQVPDCKSFDICVTSGGNVEGCCEAHQQAHSRTCTICVKAACVVRTDFCGHTGKESDAYCRVCDALVREAATHPAHPKARGAFKAPSLKNAPRITTSPGRRKKKNKPQVVVGSARPPRQGSIRQPPPASQGRSPSPTAAHARRAAVKQAKKAEPLRPSQNTKAGRAPPKKQQAPPKKRQAPPPKKRGWQPQQPPPPQQQRGRPASPKRRTAPRHRSVQRPAHRGQKKPLPPHAWNIGQDGPSFKRHQEI